MKKQAKALRWLARIVALAILALGLPFYFGYGNPLPFINPEYGLAENIGLSAFPLILIGMALGWKYEKLGGYLIVVPMALAFVLGLMTEADFPGIFLVALIPGLLYLWLGYQQ